jgi:hypothetical protein
MSVLRAFADSYGWDVSQYSINDTLYISRVLTVFN